MGRYRGRYRCTCNLCKKGLAVTITEKITLKPFTVLARKSKENLKQN